MYQKMILSLSFVFLGLMLACAPQLKVPQGMARVHQDETFRAVSPQGSVLKFYRVKNDPKAKGEYWVQSVSTHLKSEGYQLHKSQKLAMAKGDTLEWTAWPVPMQGGDYLYWVGVLTRGDDIFVLESTGPWQEMESLRPAVLKSLQGF
jgi:hypothetical protein